MNYRDNITLSSNRDLEKYGIIPLTGESCAYGMRLLCDITENGAELLDSFFGGASFTSINWNHGTDADPHTRSVMLPYSILTDLKIFTLLNVEGVAWVVVYNDNTVYGTNDEEMVRELVKYEKITPAVYSNMNPTSARDGRNVHVMSGRTR